MTEDEGEEIDTKVCKHISHLPVRVHGAVDDFSRNARQQEGRSQNGSLGLRLHLQEWAVNIEYMESTSRESVPFLSGKLNCMTEL